MIEEYFDWLVCHINDSIDVSHHSHLLSYLFHTEFRWIIPNDKNRALDGREYRKLFANGDRRILNELNSNLPNPCSVLEMLVALAVRIEFDIMHDPYRDEDCCSLWFWVMINNLKLTKFTNDMFDVDAVSEILWKFIDRKWDYAGHGSPFPLKKPKEDARHVEIWSLMNRWLSENYDF